ncbi:hypothetical protein VTO73DRAFT_8029 [Trametes versicolor]
MYYLWSNQISCAQKPEAAHTEVLGPGPSSVYHLPRTLSIACEAVGAVPQHRPHVCRVAPVSRPKAMLPTSRPDRALQALKRATTGIHALQSIRPARTSALGEDRGHGREKYESRPTHGGDSPRLVPCITRRGRRSRS